MPFEITPLLVVLGFLLQAIFLDLSAKIVDIHHRSVGKGILATIGIAIFVLIAFAVMQSMANVAISGLVAVVVVFLIAAVTVQKVFDTSFRKGFMAFGLSAVLNVLALMLVSKLMGQ